MRGFLRKISPKDWIGWGFLAGGVILIALGAGLFVLIARAGNEGPVGMAGAMAVIAICVGVWMLPGAFVKHDGEPYQTWGNQDA